MKGQLFVPIELKAMRHIIPLSALLVAISLFACVKESTSSSTGSSVHADILFPSNVSCTDADWITVRGTSSGDLDSLEVDGVNAESSDGFKTWTAEVPLDTALNTFTLVGFKEGSSPYFNLDSISITREPLAGARILELCLATEWGYMYALAENPDLGTPPVERYAVISIDPVNGRTQVISGWGVGDGVVLSPNVKAITASMSSSTVYLFDAGSDSVIKVDTVTGQRILFSGNGQGTGPTINNAKAACIAESQDKLYAIDEATNEVIAVDTVTGNRTLISGDSRGNGPGIGGVKDITFDTSDGRVLVSSSFEDAIIAINVNSGDRSIFSGPGEGEGPPLLNLSKIRYAETFDEIIAFDQATDYLMSVNAETGSRVTLDRFDWSQPDNMAYDHGTALIWMHTVDGIIFSFDKANGAISALQSRAYTGPGISVPTDDPLTYDDTRSQAVFFARGPTGSGLRALSMFSGAESVLDAFYPSSEEIPVTMCFDKRRDDLLLMRPGSTGLYGVSLSDGEMKYISGPGDLGSAPTGSGPSFYGPTDICVGPSSRLASMLEPGPPNGVLVVDLLNGDRTLISSDLTGFGPIWTNPTCVATSADAGAVWVSDESAGIYRVDPTTGQRELLGEYAGIAHVSSLTHLLHDPSLNVLYALDGNTGTILKVATGSGLASVIYGPNVTISGLHMKPTNWTLNSDTGNIILKTNSPAALVEFDPITAQGVLIAR